MRNLLEGQVEMPVTELMNIIWIQRKRERETNMWASLRVSILK